MQLKKAPPPVSDINVTPMVDVMLVVLIIFMVITPLLSKGVAVEMAKARNPITMADADKEDAVMVAITRDGKAFLSPGSILMQPDQLGEKVKDLLTNKPSKLVLCQGRSARQVRGGGRCCRQPSHGRRGSTWLLTEQLEREEVRG